MAIINFRRSPAVNASVEGPVTRRTALTYLVAGGMAAIVPRRGSAMDLNRFTAPIAITADDIGWFRECRSAWSYAESGAPGVIPEQFSQEEFASRHPREALDRLERTLCAFFLHSRFDSGRYTLQPPVRLDEAFPHAPNVFDFDVTPDHLRLFQHTNWRQWVIDEKRPYGTATFYVADMARILGIPLPRATDNEGRDTATFSRTTERQLVALHHDMQFVLQAYLQHAELSPGRYLIPADGWDSWTLPRCRPVARADMDAYLGAIARIKRQTFSNEADKVVPIFQANVFLFGDPSIPQR
jgi:hypothetical protein